MSVKIGAYVCYVNEVFLYYFKVLVFAPSHELCSCRSTEGNSAIVIEWDGRPENLRRMSYRNGKLRVEESGFYYVYANTCFRHYNLEPYSSGPREDPPVDIGNPTQLFQYFYRESIRQNGKEIVLMKTGSSMRWNNTSFNMYCAQQSRGVHLVEGDALFVNVSNAFLLDQEAEKTYFGAIKLGN